MGSRENHYILVQIQELSFHFLKIEDVNKSGIFTGLISISV